MLTLTLLNFLNGMVRLQFLEMSIIILGITRWEFSLSANSRAWSHCMDVHLYWLQRLITFGSSRLRVNKVFTKVFNEHIMYNKMKLLKLPKCSFAKAFTTKMPTIITAMKRTVADMHLACAKNLPVYNIIFMAMIVPEDNIRGTRCHDCTWWRWSDCKRIKYLEVLES